MNKTQITPYRQLDLKIYGYHLPDVPTHKGNVKVGETTLNDVRDRIVQQTGTVGVRHEFLFQRNAIRNDGRIFHDRDLHAYFRLRGIKRAMLNGKASEWYHFGDVSRAESMTDEYIAVDYDEVQISKNKLDYILCAEQAQLEFFLMDAGVCFFGHTHLPEAYAYEPSSAAVAPVGLAAGEPLCLAEPTRYLLNPGSVGQPRDGDPRASFGVYDSKEGTFELRRVEYNVRRAQEKILRAGLPPFLASRLETGG